MLIFYRNITTTCSLNRILTSILLKQNIKTSSFVFLSNDSKNKKFPKSTSKVDKLKKFSFIQLDVDPSTNRKPKTEQESIAVKLAKLIDKENTTQTAEQLLEPIKKSNDKKKVVKKTKKLESKKSDETNLLFNLTKIMKESSVEKNDKLELKDIETNSVKQVVHLRSDNYSKSHNLNDGNGLLLFDKLCLNDAMTKESPIWSMHYDEELKLAQEIPPINGFDEMIKLTNEGKLWKFPIDNEQDIDEIEAETPFHEHIFLDHYLEEFPQIEAIQQFMTLALNGISQNSYLSLNEKKDIINWYKNYFDDKLDIIKEALNAEKLEQEYRHAVSNDDENKRKEKSPIQI